MPAPKKDLLAFIKIPPVEVDEWFDDKTRELSVLDNQLKKLHAAAQLLCEGRKDLSHHTDRFSKSFAALAQVEEMKQLTSAMHRLADVEAKVQRLHANQARRDMFDFSEIIFDYISLVGSCKVALVQVRPRCTHARPRRTHTPHALTLLFPPSLLPSLPTISTARSLVCFLFLSICLSVRPAVRLSVYLPFPPSTLTRPPSL